MEILPDLVSLADVQAYVTQHVRPDRRRQGPALRRSTPTPRCRRRSSPTSSAWSRCSGTCSPTPSSSPRPGGVTLERRAPRRRADRVRGGRHRRRHPPGQAAGDLRGLPAGRRHDQPQVRRHRPRPVDQPRAGARPRRRDRSVEHGRGGRDLHPGPAAAYPRPLGPSLDVPAEGVDRTASHRARPVLAERATGARRAAPAPDASAEGGAAAQPRTPARRARSPRRRSGACWWWSEAAPPRRPSAASRGTADGVLTASVASTKEAAAALDEQPYDCIVLGPGIPKTAMFALLGASSERARFHATPLILCPDRALTDARAGAPAAPRARDRGQGRRTRSSSSPPRPRWPCIGSLRGPRTAGARPPTRSRATEARRSACAAGRC